MKYIIPVVNGGIEITNPQIKLDGSAGAPIVDDVSLGGFYADLKLTFGSPNNVKVGLRVYGETQPEDTTSLESIKEWAIAQLDAQYGEPEQ